MHFFLKFLYTRAMKLLKIVFMLFILVSIVTGFIIASFDPVEQAKKAQDEKYQSSSAEFIQASVQYYSTRGGLPWFGTEESGAGCFEGGKELQTIPLNVLRDCIQLMADETTLRRDFLSTINPKMLIITNPNPQTNNELDSVVCFQPQSKTWQKDINTRYNQDGTNAQANRCFSQGGSEYCYWCTQ